MDTTNTMPVVQTVKSSRLPAGSTLEVAPGIHVAHPHAEVNLPGAGDPRIGDTKAVTEYTPTPDVDTKEVITWAQKPLADEVKPKVVTVNQEAQPVIQPASEVASTETATTPGANLAVEQPSLHKTE